MTYYVFGYGFIIFTAILIILADYLIKLAADAGHTASSNYVFIGVVLYAGSAVLWFFAMQHITLVRAGVAYSMHTLIAPALIGRFGSTDRSKCANTQVLAAPCCRWC